MSEFEQGLANIMGSFIQTELDCVEKQNQEIEQLQQENQQLKEVIEEVREYIKNNATDENGDIGINFYAWQTYELLQILDKVKDKQ